MAYSKTIPKSLGALCDQCPLRDLEYIPSELNVGTTLVVGQYPIAGQYPPGTRNKTPFSGEPRDKMEQWLSDIGKTWSDISTTDMVACCTAKKGQRSDPPSDDVYKCCLPKVKKEISGYQTILLYGLTPKRYLHISCSFGQNVTWQGKTVYAAEHPATKNWAAIEPVFKQAVI